MAGFFGKIGLGGRSHKSSPRTPAQTRWQDETDPRIFYQLRPRARRITIKMDAAKREVVVTVPGTARSLGDAKHFVREKYDWILVQLEGLVPSQPFVENGTILFRGEAFRLLCPGTRGRPYVDMEARQIHVPASPDTFAGRTKRLLIREAREALTICTHVHADTLGKPVDKISVRDTSSRWGSCLKGNAKRGGQISYSWRLICAPPFVLDYVCAHECAHLVHANHGADYWELCNSLVDTVKPAKRWLTTNGNRLHAVGAGD